MPKINETINSPHQSNRGDHIPKLIVYHICDGYYEGTKGWFSNPASQTSSHYIVGKDGRICQCVPIWKMAWCNGTTTDKSKNTWYGHATVPLVKELGGNANQYSTSIECEGFYKETGGALTAAQFEAIVWLTEYIRESVKKEFNHTIPIDRRFLVGHYEVNPITKPKCPGEKFPWSELIAKLQGQDNSPKGTLYRVQVGAFGKRENAAAYLKDVQKEYPSTFIAGPGDDGLYRVQVGAFAVKANAEAFLRDVKSRGFPAFLVIEEK